MTAPNDKKQPQGFSDWWHFTGRKIPGDRLAIALEAWSAAMRAINTLPSARGDQFLRTSEPRECPACWGNGYTAGDSETDKVPCGICAETGKIMPYSAPSSIGAPEWDVRGWWKTAQECGGQVSHEDGWTLVATEQLNARQQHTENLQSLVSATRTK
jgi:hypothetical protein